MSDQASEHLPSRERVENTAYNPLIQLRRDFNSRSVHLTEAGEAIIDDPDLQAIMSFYRDSVKGGSILNLGAGTTHLHYMMALEDKASHVTALDLGPQHIQVLQELFDSLRNRNNFDSNKYVTVEDAEVLRMTAEAIAENAHLGAGRTGEQIITNLVRKSSREDGSADLVLGDMYNLSVLGDQRFDNIIISIALFVAQNGEDLARLFSGVKGYLTDAGKLVIVDFQGFGEEEVDTDFPEPPEVRARYRAPYLTAELLREKLGEAGFSQINVQTKPVEAVGLEQEHGLTYLFAEAKYSSGKFSGTF